MGQAIIDALETVGRRPLHGVDRATQDHRCRAGYVGMTCAQLCAQKNLASEVVVIDVADGRAKGIALDSTRWRRSRASRRASRHGRAARHLGSDL